MDELIECASVNCLLGPPKKKVRKATIRRSVVEEAKQELWVNNLRWTRMFGHIQNKALRYPRGHALQTPENIEEWENSLIQALIALQNEVWETTMALEKKLGAELDR